MAYPFRNINDRTTLQKSKQYKKKPTRTYYQGTFRLHNKPNLTKSKSIKYHWTLSEDYDTSVLFINPITQG